MHCVVRVLLRALEAMVHGRRLTRTDLPHGWPGAKRIRVPAKALDRQLGNTHLHAEREHIYSAMTRWLVRSTQHVVVVDWSDLKADRSWHLLRAAIPVGGRTLPILNMVLPAGKQGSPKAEKEFLRRLARVLPDDASPILVTDAGFRGPWFRAVEAMGWQWLGCLRNTTYLRPVEVPHEPAQWVSCKAMYERPNKHLVTLDRWKSRAAIHCLHASCCTPSHGEAASIVIDRASWRVTQTAATTRSASANLGC
jgi:hypothetical protein